MKLLFFLLLLLCINTVASAQIGGRKSKDDIMVFDSIKVSPGDTLYFGQGSDHRGDFRYIYEPANYWAGTKEMSLPRTYANKYGIIKHFKIQRDKRTGEKVVAVINPWGGFNFAADIEGAINANEIVAINSRPFTKKPEFSVTVQQQNTLSMADELAKLKKLFDDGVLTREEYDAAKKKVIEKN